MLRAAILARALDLTVDSSLLWMGAALALVAAVILAFVPRLPVDASGGLHLASATTRITGSTRRQRVFVVTQIAASFVLLAGAGGGTLTPGRSVQYGSRPMTNLFLGMAHRFGLRKLDRFGDSTGPLEHL